jgi:riboflavin kinase / FMN adenylyltransferase
VGNDSYPSVTNVGMNPTFGNNCRTIEAYLLDYHNDLLGQEVKIDFIHKLRNEIKFDNANDLVKQIFEDIRQARTILKVEAKVRDG